MTSESAENGGSAPAITVTGEGQLAAWRSRDLPPVERLAGGIWSIPVPFPDNPLRYTLTYLVPGAHGAVVIDPGWHSEQGWQALLGGLRTAGLGVADVVGIVATHIHPDHHGLSRRLREASGAWVGMHPAERDFLLGRSARQNRPVGSRAGVEELMEVAGAPAAEIEAFLLGFDRANGPGFLDLIEPDVLLEDGDLVPLPGRRLFAVWTPGHTPGHLCLREPDARVLLTGDCVLPRITPNLGLGADGSSPLPRFFDSLRKVAHYDDHEALPAHEYRFRGLAVRSEQLLDHHDRRCREIVAVVGEAGSPTVWQLAERLTWSRPWAEVGRMKAAALAETMAHVVYLVDEGELRWTTPGGLLGGARPARVALPERSDPR